MCCLIGRRRHGLGRRGGVRGAAKNRRLRLVRRTRTAPRETVAAPMPVQKSPGHNQQKECNQHALPPAVRFFVLEQISNIVAGGRIRQTQK